MSTVTIILWIIIFAFLAFFAWNYIRVRRAAKYISNAEFENMMRKAQVVDLRSPSEFRRKHILGARNLPSEQFKESLSALRKDKPVLLYDNTRGQLIARAVLILKKAGYKDLYVLKNGLDYWNGKVKEQG
ncbi:rhodanese-like domain-containing protein [Streptococcus orisasini]|uniref:rhodanese-like domain-containing protein n=1 Tax=Streptococcus orisasini TaxID=1080071 RepID=UPI000709866A|nr:rhodanese-like domain-containing protein [Streptococcus orisasini]